MSDLESLDIDGDSELRPGGYGVIGMEHRVAAGLGVHAAARVDFVRRATHFRAMLGLRCRL